MNEYTLPSGEKITSPEPDHVDTGGHCYVNIYYPTFHGRPEGRTIVVGFVDEFGDESDCEFVNEYNSLDEYENSDEPKKEWRSYDPGFAEMTIDQAIDILNEAVNDLADWGSINDPDFEDKELQGQRVTDHLKAVKAIDVISKAHGRG